MRSVAEALAAKLVLVAEAADPSGMHVRVVAGWYDGAPFEEPFEYDPAGQPCALVPGQTLVSFPEGPVEQFPEDQGAGDMGLESHLAVRLRDSRKNYLGHLAVLDERRMETEPEYVAVLKIFAARAGTELERRNREAALQARARPCDRGRGRRAPGASAATCTTAPSSGCSPSPTCCGSPGASPQPPGSCSRPPSRS